MNTIKTKKTSEARRKANDKWDKSHMKMISVNLNKEIFEMLESGVKKSGLNRNKFVTAAIIEKLERDGFLKNDDNKNV